MQQLGSCGHQEPGSLVCSAFVCSPAQTNLVPLPINPATSSFGRVISRRKRRRTSVKIQVYRGCVTRENDLSIGMFDIFVSTQSCM